MTRAFAWLRAEAGLPLLALQFLTRLPLPNSVADWAAFSAERQRRSARYFPLVGLAVGAWGALVTAFAHCLWPLSIAVGLGIAATLLLTGALHEDGWADTCDGLGGSATRERALEIMKDSRLGTYGVLGLVVVLGLKASALFSLAQASLPAALAVSVWAHGLSRLAAVATMLRLPYAGDVGRAKVPGMASAGAADVTRVFLPGALILLAAGWALAHWVSVMMLLTAVAGAIASTWDMQIWLRRRLGGQTGDTLGAVQQISELGALLGALAVQAAA